jgi:hypothetical protein
MTEDISKLFSQYRKWNSIGLTDNDGVVVASDLQQEWLLPWWWENYRRFNSHPVVFIDFGMSKEMKVWCQERGALIPLLVPDIFVASKEEMDPDLVARMEDETGKMFWCYRNAWFKKPLACLQSPFKRTLWIDLDCQIRGYLGDLFESFGDGLSMTRYPNPTMPYPIYNSGIIVFKHGLSVFEAWADLCIEQNHLFRGDEDILAWLLKDQNMVAQLPAIYNWSRCFEDNPEAIVFHWHGAKGKYCIHHQIMTSNLQSLGF